MTRKSMTAWFDVSLETFERNSVVYAPMYRSPTSISPAATTTNTGHTVQPAYSYGLGRGNILLPTHTAVAVLMLLCFTSLILRPHITLLCFWLLLLTSENIPLYRRSSRSTTMRSSAYCTLSAMALVYSRACLARRKGSDSHRSPRVHSSSPQQAAIVNREICKF